MQSKFQDKLELKVIVGNSIKEYIDDLAQLRIEVFKDYPYLYDGDISYEKKYLQTYMDCKDSMIIIILYEGRVIGASTCLPLVHAEASFKEPFVKHKYDIEKMFYFGESVILSPFRGLGIGQKFFQLREQYSLKVIPDLSYTTFCSVVRHDEHPKKPEGYQGLDQFWLRNGYKKLKEATLKYSWKDIDNDREDDKTMNIWLKQFET